MHGFFLRMNMMYAAFRGSYGEVSRGLGVSHAIWAHYKR